jgi:hypothetical protein
MNWRIYRLPGSREVWHIDSGPGTPIYNVRGYSSSHSHSVDVGGNHVPRAWIEVPDAELYIVNGVAVFEKVQTKCAVAQD